MPALLTAADIRAHVETALDDAALQVIIDRVDADLVRRAGPHSGPLTETMTGRTMSAYVNRPITSVTSVREGATVVAETSALSATDEYRLWPAEGRIERLPAGTRFAAVVEVVYTPVDETEGRKRVLLELVRLDLAQSGRAQERIGSDYRYRGLNYEEHRNALIREARPFLVLE